MLSISITDRPGAALSSQPRAPRAFKRNCDACGLRVVGQAARAPCRSPPSRRADSSSRRDTGPAARPGNRVTPTVGVQPFENVARPLEQR